MGIFNYLKSKKKLLDEIDRLNKFLKIKVDMIKELNPASVYFIKANSEKEAIQIKSAIESIKDSIPWTIPLFIVSDKDLKEVKNVPIHN